MKRFSDKGRSIIVLGTAFLLICTGISVVARDTNNPKLKYSKKFTLNSFRSSELPKIEYTLHNRGNIQLAIASNGTFGTQGQTMTDPLTGGAIPSCIYPKNSDLVYLWVGALWIGAIVGRDTLVSTANEDYYENLEFWALPGQPGEFEFRSMDINSFYYDPERLGFSEQDIICQYYDTVTNSALINPDPFDQTRHKPLGLRIDQRSMAWSYSYAEDFVLFDYKVTNIGTDVLRKVYMGIYVDGDAFHTLRNNESGWNDDMVGFYRTHPAPEGCNFVDTLNIAWHADNDGDPDGGVWNNMSVKSVLGSMVVRTPSDSLEYSYNWWITGYGDVTRDFGPRKLPAPNDPFRSFGAELGTPRGDKNKYYVLRHKEFDYDLLTIALDHTNEGYLRPPSNADSLAFGWDTRYLLSFGPFNIDPGETLPISFAWVAGSDFHVNPDDFDDFDPMRPHEYIQKLNFDNLATNARWASWVYDNPGVDTDDDGYAGEFRFCATDSFIASIDTTIIDSIILVIDTSWTYTASDTSWYKGDGVPDFRGAGPPPAPKMNIIPTVGKLLVRWNGYYSENTKDVFSGLLDFEGYRVYISRDDRRTSFSLITSYDRENFNRYRYDAASTQSNKWVLEGIPFTLDSLRVIYDDQNFDPLIYRVNSPLNWGGEQYYFTPQDFNVSELGETGTIRKAYPNVTAVPGTDPSLWDPAEITYEHGEPLPMYYEYEFEIENLLPTVPYYVSITTFDFGSPISGLPALETDILNNMIAEYPLETVDAVIQNELDVFIYPNPYRSDREYEDRGFENLGTDLASDKFKRIHFANLPAKCRISIYSLDGDLIREIFHDKNPAEPSASHDTWDIISRNTQTVVSGLYYWVVESDTRIQMGKLVIIK
ncbi:MAG: hypothetical protein IIA17_08000 [candidate division Zixibacteria bacterium]|nr:hypothetical protein [candidate division Zixibacteria bacterium]